MRMGHRLHGIVSYETSHKMRGMYLSYSLQTHVPCFKIILEVTFRKNDLNEIYSADIQLMLCERACQKYSLKIGCKR